MTAFSKARILLVDDEVEVRKILGKTLENNDFYVETAANWGEAHTKLSTGRFDLMLIDLHMPGIAGDRYSQVVRETQAGRDIKIVLFSNEDKDILAKKAIQAKVDGYILKSEPISSFLQKLSAHLPLLTAGPNVKMFQGLETAGPPKSHDDN